MNVSDLSKRRRAIAEKFSGTSEIVQEEIGKNQDGEFSKALGQLGELKKGNMGVAQGSRGTGGLKSNHGGNPYDKEEPQAPNDKQTSEGVNPGFQRPNVNIGDPLKVKIEKGEKKWITIKGKKVLIGGAPKMEGDDKYDEGDEGMDEKKQMMMKKKKDMMDKGGAGSDYKGGGKSKNSFKTKTKENKPQMSDKGMKKNQMMKNKEY